MTEIPFFAVTVENIPSYVGDREIAKMWLDWGGGTNASEACKALEAHAKEKGYHGIIGLRFESFTL